MRKAQCPRVKHKPFAGSARSVQRIADNRFSKAVTICRSKPKLMGSSCMRNKAHARYSPFSSVCRRNIFFRTDGVPFGNGFFSVNVVPYLVRAVINVNTEEKFRLTVRRRNYSVNKGDIFFLYLTFLKLPV